MTPEQAEIVARFVAGENDLLRLGPDFSSALRAALAEKDKELEEDTGVIRVLRRHLDEKDAEIERLRARLIARKGFPMTAPRVSEKEVEKAIDLYFTSNPLSSGITITDAVAAIRALLSERKALEAGIAAATQALEEFESGLDLAERNIVAANAAIDRKLAEARKAFARKALDKRNETIRKAANVGASMASAEIAFESWLRQEAGEEGE